MKMSLPIRGKGGHLCFPIDQKNINFVEYDMIVLLSLKYVIWLRPRNKKRFI